MQQLNCPSLESRPHPCYNGGDNSGAEVTTAAAVAVAVAAAVVVASQKQWCGRWQRRILCNNGGDEGNGGASRHCM